MSGAQQEGSGAGDEVMARTGVIPSLVSVDDGYASKANVAGARARGIDVISISGSKGRAASTVMQYQVISTGKTVWDIGLQAHLFEVFVLSEKLALDEAREPLLRTITREGHVYAR